MLAESAISFLLVATNRCAICMISLVQVGERDTVHLKNLSHAHVQVNVVMGVTIKTICPHNLITILSEH